MEQKKQTFEQRLRLFEYKVDLRTAFDDFLTMAICAFGRNTSTGKSYDEDLYLQTVDKYKDDNLRFEFPKLLACLTMEMDNRIQSENGWDVLGEFYEQNLQRSGLSQFFTPWHICTFMAKSTVETAKEHTSTQRPLRILDPSCGSGRMLMATSRIAGPCEDYFGVDIDHTCVKMTAINLFLSGLFRIEVMHGNFLLPDDFRESYRTSFIPFGLYRIQDKEKSRLWNLLQSIPKKEGPTPPEFTTKLQSDGSQLKFF